MTAPNHNKLWTIEDSNALCKDFFDGLTLRQLCEKYGRKPYGIISKLTIRGMLVQHGGYYHRVEPDPWETMDTVSEMNEHYSPKKGKKSA